jgi:glutathione S-transferase
MGSGTADGEALLVVIPISHYCEKARWALERLGVPHRIEAHAPGFHVPAVKALGVGTSTSTPVLRLLDGTVLADSSLILKHCDTLAEQGGVERLFPPAIADKVASLCAQLDGTLGKDARQVVYASALSTAEIRRAAAAPPVTSGERFAWTWTGLSFLVTQVLMRHGMDISQTTGAQALDRIRATFAEMGALLSDGRPYLLGDAFTAADLTFVALSLPVLGIPYGAIPEGQRPFEMGPKPAALAAIEAELRDTAAGRFALRVWAEQRQVRAS